MYDYCEVASKVGVPWARAASKRLDDGHARVIKTDIKIISTVGTATLLLRKIAGTALRENTTRRGTECTDTHSPIVGVDKQCTIGVQEAP